MQTENQTTFEGFSGILAWRAWRPPTQPRAVLVLAHGYAEHIGRYAHVAEYFTGRGYAVYGYDMAGHGLSEGRRGRITHFFDYLEDLRRFIVVAQTREPELPIFVVGHSQGGLIALAYGETNPPGLDRHGLSCSAIRVGNARAGLEVRLGQIYVEARADVFDVKRHPGGALDARQRLSGAYAQNDPLIVKVASARWATEFSQAQTDTLAAAHRFRLPCLITAWQRRPTINPDGTRKFFAARAQKTRP